MYYDYMVEIVCLIDLFERNLDFLCGENIIIKNIMLY